MNKCQSKCKLDDNTQSCLGCGRSLYEIKQAYEEYRKWATAEHK